MFKQKYLKYKKKYLDLKNHHAGAAVAAEDQTNSTEGQTNSVDSLWHKIIHVSSTLRQEHNENFDGDAFWKSFKPLLKKINVPMQWNLKNHKKLVKSFESQADIINKDKDDDGNLIEHIHFIKQLLKIPYKDDGECSFTRFMQLALNFGQLKGSTYDEPLNELINSKLDQLGNYNSYINELPNISSDLSEIFKILDGHLKKPPLK
tara:strand:- start:4078 stop:4692 length:615 start_codon:yes stop_codon:yes gene_type:complete